MITPLEGARTTAGVLGAARAAVYLLEADRSPPAPVAERRLQTLFDLTAAESQVAHELMGGASPEQIAQARGRSIETIRGQVKSLLAKTRLRRTADLQALKPLISGPFGS